MKSAVAARGTLNKRDDKDKGWSVEGTIPWKRLAADRRPAGSGRNLEVHPLPLRLRRSFRRAGAFQHAWRRAACRKPISITARITPRSSSSGPKKELSVKPWASRTISR